MNEEVEKRLGHINREICVQVMKDPTSNERARIVKNAADEAVHQALEGEADIEDIINNMRSKIDSDLKA